MLKMEKKFFKSILFLLIIQAFLYWFLKLFQTNPNYINFYIDHNIPFIKNFVYIYDTFYPFYFFVFFLIYRKDENIYFKGLLATFLSTMVCDMIFIAYPTIMIRPDIPAINGFTDLILKITYTLDEPALNCFPSIHCLFCFQIIISTILSDFKLKHKILIIVYAILIVSSTMLIKQHYFFDMISALAISLVFNIIVMKLNLVDKLKIKKLFS